MFIYFIGHLQSIAREYWLQQHSACWMRACFLALVALIFPDLQAFNLIDEIVAGAVIPLGIVRQNRCCSEFFTSTIYALLATFVFSGKEL